MGRNASYCAVMSNRTSLSSHSASKTAAMIPCMKFNFLGLLTSGLSAAAAPVSLVTQGSPEILIYPSATH